MFLPTAADEMLWNKWDLCIVPKIKLKDGEQLVLACFS